MILPLVDAVREAASQLAVPQNVRRILFTGKQRNAKPPFIRVTVRPVLLKSGLRWQEVSHDGKKDFTSNFEINQLNLLNYLESGFSNLQIETIHQELQIRVTKSGDAQLVVRKVSHSGDDDIQEVELTHDRTKKRFLESNDPVFSALGISDKDGNLKPSRSDKFKQVQEFLKSIEYVLSELMDEANSAKTIRLVDLGCGHAYLTFAAHAYLKKLGYEVITLGVDERVDSRDRNLKIAKDLAIDKEINFVANQISDVATHQVDVAIALHACDTATDDAIAWAVKNDAKAILVAPCCQHDIQRQISDVPEPWSIATRYGILQERIGDILTDSIRAQILRILGYRTEIIEFIAGTHTAKNLMIRAVKPDSSGGSDAKNYRSVQRDFVELDELLQQWKVKPKLMNLLGRELDDRHTVN